MSKKLITSRFNLVGLIKKGKAMYDKYNVIEPAEEPVEVAPKTISSIRQEIEKDNSFEDCLSTLEDAAGIALDGRITNPDEVQKALNALASVAQDTIRYAEEQETRREELLFSHFLHLR